MRLVNDNERRAYAQWSMGADALKTKERVVKGLREAADKIEKGSCLEMLDYGRQVKKLGQEAVNLGATWHECFPPREMRQ